MREAIHLGLESGLLDLKPCWLVDPSVACELLPLKPGLFDIVVFDEASQCPIEHAVPVIYRGTRLVVTGDQHQLPPTSFFLPKSESDDSELDTDAEATDEPVRQRVKIAGIQAVMETDELLTAAIELGALPEAYLRVHYRSEHPDLIRFSNHAFYDGNLEIPPVAGLPSGETARPIVYVPVDGQYEDRTNRKEAERVGEILTTYWLGLDHPAPTIGVVTFNLQQRDLIEDLLRQRCQSDPAFEARYREETQRRESNLDVGFFVKNLENVQGDERDVMIFSMTFGRGADGRFYRRFGPVGAEHGERRLNVAVTRAKKLNIVLNSMPIEEISPVLSQSGVGMARLTPKCYLQMYLAYAKAVWEGDADQVSQLCRSLATSGGPHVDSLHEPESPLEEDVGREIERMGFQVEYQVGESGFRIDIGVSQGQAKGRYLLGVECDGASFHSNWSARHRDVWRENILRSRGWRIHRVWSPSWWYHRADEIAKLQTVLAERAHVH
jgi:very-short-patch-repair endonuclease